jgi:hypothetical protein
MTQPMRNAISRLLTTGGKAIEPVHDKLRAGLNNVVGAIGVRACACVCRLHQWRLYYMRAVD